MVAIAPSMLAANMATLGDDLSAIADTADYIHLDVMDGHFVPNLSFGPAIIAALRPLTDTPFDVHLMIENPEQWVKDYADAGADIISIHAEASSHLDRLLGMIKDLGKKSGLAINPATPVDIVRHLLDKIDIIVVMSVNPGFGGQKYLPYANQKISSLKQMIEGFDILIEVDGGVDASNAKMAIDAGADILVAGSSIFKQNDYRQAIHALRTII